MSPGMPMIWLNLPEVGLMTSAAKSSIRARCPEGEGVVGSWTASFSWAVGVLPASMRVLCPEGEEAVSSTASFSWAMGVKPVAIKAGTTGPRSAQVPDVGMPNRACTGGRLVDPEAPELRLDSGEPCRRRRWRLDP
jgi:hypothetical protein